MISTGFGVVPDILDLERGVGREEKFDTAPIVCLPAFIELPVVSSELFEDI